MEDTARLSLIIKRVRQEGREIRSFDMLPEGAQDSHGLSFIPGQVALLQAGDERPGYFAFASAPEDAEVEFLVKRGGGVSGLVYEMAEGSRVELAGIVGSGFALDSQQGKDLVFVAMGTGVAPLRSALRYTLRHAKDYGQAVVLYGARTPDDFCYRDEVADWEAAGVEMRQVISRPDGHDWSGPTGYVQSLLDHVLPDLKDPVALICGSREMIGQTRDRLQQMGFAPEAILTNY
jgi:sulfhydrogenase subunit gamma (sulfur reductase)